MRPHCHNCLKPIKTCYCDGLVKFNNKTNIIILRHPSELKHSIQTAHLSKLIFDNIFIMDGEDFSHNKIINSLDINKTILLYPKENFVSIKSLNNKQSIKNIILLDGTWKKTYKIYQLSKNLHCLKKVAIHSPHQSHLKLRKAPKDGLLSTYETIALSLEYIEDKSFKNYEIPLKYMQEKIQMNYSK